ncbi:MAG: hypothetical protein L0I62_09650, partial [Gammaproteobacteria bacterium]|nr:hypothetical protein [Gammaproteobacteria bacterium]
QGEFQFKVVKDGSDVASGAQAPGYLDVTGSRGGVTAVTRFFWQMWPNGLRFDPASGTMQVQLFPAWGKMWVQRVNDPAPHFTQSGLYWLQDMQAVYKQVLLDFHGSSAPSNERLHALAATFNHAPVPIIPTSWYAATHVTLDMYGLIPYTTQQGTGGSRKDDYTAHNPFAYNDAAGINYNFGWDQFLANVTRKWGSENAGGWPHAVARDIILTGNPAAWYYAGEFAMGELNMHPQWMPGYSYEEDYERVPVTPTAKYNETSWRQTGGLAAPPLEGTRSRTSRPRGDEHGWFYQIAQAYNFNDNPWIEDWYGFIGEMRLARLHNRYPQDSTDRGRGHAFSNALQAFRVTGDMDIIHQSQWFVQLLRSWQSRRYGAMHGGYAKSGQIGFLARALISYMAEVQGYNREGWAQAFQCLSGIIVWNLVYGNFGYAVDAAAGEHGQSAITGQNMANPQAWYYLHTGRDTFRQQILAYIDTGINGGCAAKDCARGVGDWGKDGKGGFVGRTSTYVYHHEKADLTPPAKIADLSAERIGDGNVKVSFTVPTGNARRYHFVYARKPISATYTAEEAKMNWWAAHVQAPEITADPGQTASFVFHTNIADPFYMAMFSFDDHDTLSEMSNLYDLAQGIRNGDGLIPPWQFDNVGSPPPSGSVSYGVNSNVYDLGTYTIESNGSFHGDTGEFAFVHQDAGGNQAIAFRVTSATYFTRVGPMFRESLTSASRFVALFYTGSHDLRLVYRSDTGGDKTTFYLGEAQEPVYLKLVRDGDTYTAYASPDGIDWGDALKSVTVSTLPADVQAGVAAGSSSVDGQAYPAQAKVDHLAVAGS